MSRLFILCSIGVGLLGALASFAVAAFATAAGEPAMMHVYPYIATLVVVSAVAVMATATAIQFRLPTIAAFQFAMAIVLTARDRAFKDRVMQRAAYRRPVRLAVQF